MLLRSTGPSSLGPSTQSSSTSALIRPLSSSRRKLRRQLCLKINSTPATLLGEFITPAAICLAGLRATLNLSKTGTATASLSRPSIPTRCSMSRPSLIRRCRPIIPCRIPTPSNLHYFIRLLSFTVNQSSNLKRCRCTPRPICLSTKLIRPTRKNIQLAPTICQLRT